MAYAKLVSVVQGGYGPEESAYAKLVRVVQGGYAIPPLDGEAHRVRKHHLINTITSKESAEKYLAKLDPVFTAAFNGAGQDGQFSLFQLVAK